MKLSDLAYRAGVKIVRCDPGSGGKWGYTDAKYPNCTIAGFKTKKEVLQHWAEDIFGPELLGAITHLLNNQRPAP